VWTIKWKLTSSSINKLGQPTWMFSCSKTIQVSPSLLAFLNLGYRTLEASYGFYKNLHPYAVAYLLFCRNVCTNGNDGILYL
jgi:hypothetical protein